MCFTHFINRIIIPLLLFLNITLFRGTIVLDLYETLSGSKESGFGPRVYLRPFSKIWTTFTLTLFL